MKAKNGLRRKLSLKAFWVARENKECLCLISDAEVHTWSTGATHFGRIVFLPNEEELLVSTSLGVPAENDWWYSYALRLLGSFFLLLRSTPYLDTVIHDRLKLLLTLWRPNESSNPTTPNNQLGHRKPCISSHGPNFSKQLNVTSATRVVALTSHACIFVTLGRIPLVGFGRERGPLEQMNL